MRHLAPEPSDALLARLGADVAITQTLGSAELLLRESRHHPNAMRASAAQILPHARATLAAAERVVRALEQQCQRS